MIVCFMTDLEEILNTYPTKKDAYAVLEFARWGEAPYCPYCHSNRKSDIKNSRRYHCNTCNTSYSATTGTFFHKTKVDLQKWFYIILNFQELSENVSSRMLAKSIKVTKDTAWRMVGQLRNAIREEKDFLNRIKEILQNEKG